jgi:hypothetical protein
MSRIAPPMSRIDSSFDKAGIMNSPHLIIASPHRYADLARLWYRSISRDLVPAFEGVGVKVDVLIFCDDRPSEFEPAWFPGATLVSAGPAARDHVEFYESTLSVECDYLFFIDADVFMLDGHWAAAHLPLFDDPDLAAVSFMNRADRVGPLYALLCRRSAYLELSPPVLTKCYERMEEWPRSIFLDDGDRAAIRLEARGKRLVRIGPEALESRLIGFEGATLIRLVRALFGPIIGQEKFEAYVGKYLYYSKAACTNALLGALYQALFDAPFAPGDDGVALGGSLTVEATRRLVSRFRDAKDQAELCAYVAYSERALARLAALESIMVTPPPLRLKDGASGGDAT